MTPAKGALLTRTSHTRTSHTPLARAALALATFATLTFTAACSDSAVTGAQSVTSVEVTAPAQTLRAGGTLTLGLTLKNAAGNAVENVAVYWSSSNPSVATVSSSGVVTATSPGDVTIAASALGKSATTRITVTDREVASVQVSPATFSVRIASTVTLAARAFDAEGNTLVRTITWSTSDPTVATVTSSGAVTGVAAGAATITATSEGRSGTAAVTVTVNPVATVTVSPIRDTIGVSAQSTLVAQVRDAAGALLTGRALAWSSSDVQVATVSSTGVVTGLAPGTVTITAASEGRIGTATIVVLARLASTVTLSPANATIVTGTTVQLTSQITDPAGNVLTGRPISFASDNNAVATVNATGLITAVTPGTARITATSEGKTGTATIIVTALPVATVNVTPTTSTIFIGSTAVLNAQPLSETGAALTGRTVSWISGAPGVATVSASGLVTAVASGTAVIVAVVDGVSGTATITVRAHPVGAVAITPAAPSVAVGATTQLGTTLRDDTGTIITGRTVTWASADESVAFVSSSGLVVGLKAGTTTISATSEGVIGTTIITVR